MGNAETAKEDTSFLDRIEFQKISKIKTGPYKQGNTGGARDEYLKNEP